MSQVMKVYTWNICTWNLSSVCLPSAKPVKHSLEQYFLWSIFTIFSLLQNLNRSEGIPVLDWCFNGKCRLLKGLYPPNECCEWENAFFFQANPSSHPYTDNRSVCAGLGWLFGSFRAILCDTPILLDSHHMRCAGQIDVGIRVDLFYVHK